MGLGTGASTERFEGRDRSADRGGAAFVKSVSVLRLERFLEADPGNVALAAALLDATLTEGGINALIGAVDALSPAQRQHPDIQLRCGHAWLAAGKPERAIEVLGPVVALDPAHLAARHDLAFAQLCVSDADAAYRTLAPVFEGEYVPIEIRTLQARVVRARGDLIGALQLLQAEEVDAGIEALGLRAVLHLDAGDSTSAERDALVVLARQPIQVEALLVMGTLALWSRALESAAACFEQILRVAPRIGRALAGLGQVRLLRGDIAGARQVLEAATDAMPDHLGTWHALAWTCLLEADVARASDAFQSAYALDRTFGETHGGIALIHVLRHEPVEADAAIKRALRLDAKGRTAHYARSLQLLDAGDPDLAAREVDGILDGLALPEGMTVADFLERLRRMMEHV